MRRAGWRRKRTPEGAIAESIYDETGAVAGLCGAATTGCADESECDVLRHGIGVGRGVPVFPAAGRMVDAERRNAAVEREGRKRTRDVGCAV